MALSFEYVLLLNEISHLFDNNVPFDNTTPCYLINLLWKLGLDLTVALFSHFFAENNENLT